MIAKIPEQDKRQILMGKYANLFTKYIEKWHHFPLRANEASSVTDLYALLLSTVGYDVNGKLLSELPFVVVEEVFISLRILCMSIYVYMCEYICIRTYIYIHIKRMDVNIYICI